MAPDFGLQSSIMERNYPINFLDKLSQEGSLFSSAADGSVQCQACALRCQIRPGQRGICQVRVNRDGKLFVPWGYVAAAQTDPIEKKPFFHFLPGSRAFTFGMLGCDFRCSFCQNWEISQTFRDPAAAIGIRSIQETNPAQIVSAAVRSGSQMVVSSYNEPLITAEWAAAIFEPAQKAGLYGAIVSNGHATPQVLHFLKPYLTALKIDLKSMQAKNYQAMGGKLAPVLETIQLAQQLGIWLEVVTLVIPGFNDSVTELWETARFLASVSPAIPWHVTAYHPDYRMDNPPTPPETLQQAADIGQEAGLNFVYAGNLPGRVGSLENTYCPHCQTLLIRRSGFNILDNFITSQGTCNNCGQKIPGIWSTASVNSQRVKPY